MESGVLTEIPLTGTAKLEAENAAKVVKVDLAFKVTPGAETVKDAHAAASIQSSAYLRFTPPTYATVKPNAPCE
jgi:hypothetical protein